MTAAVASDGRTGGSGLPDAADPREPRDRILAAALAAIGDRGVSGLTLDDVARRAGCGRATVYRTFPGGRDEVVGQAVRLELDRFSAEVGERLDAEADLAGVLAAALHATACFAVGSRPLRAVLAEDPGAVLAHVAFDRSPVVFAAAHELLAPRLAAHVAEDRVAELAEWAARLALSYLAVPNPALDLTDPAVARHLVTTYVLPGLRDDVAPSGVSSPAPSHAPSTVLRLNAAPVPRTSRS